MIQSAMQLCINLIYFYSIDFYATCSILLNLFFCFRFQGNWINKSQTAVLTVN